MMPLNSHIEQNEAYDWDKDPVQEWVVSYKKEGVWETIHLPGEEDVDTGIIENLMLDLNKKYPMIYARRKLGYLEKKRHKFKKGDFFGIL